ncbi:ATP-grasp domain-containing protein [Lactococcus lactis]
MMSIVILDREGSEKRPYFDWLKGFKENIYVLGYKETINSFRDKRAIGFPEFEENPDVENYILYINSTDPISHVFSFEEGSVIRSAAIRKNLNLAGQTVESALQFRDKLIMKNIMKNASVPVPDFQAYHHIMDLLCFIKQHGFPILLKPRNKWASKGVVKVDSYETLKEYLRKNKLENYMMEEYVEGNEYHVDGVVVEGRIKFICASQYLNNCLKLYENNECLGSIMLDRHSELSQRLFNFADRVLSSMHCPSFTPFHMEVFVEEGTQQMKLCEIGSRSVGGDYTKVIEKAYGINLDKYYILSELGLPLPDIKNNTALYGKVWIPPQKGYISSIPLLNDFGAYEQENSDYENQYFNGLKKQMDYLLTVSFTGKNEEELTKNALSIKKFFLDNIIWKQ